MKVNLKQEIKNAKIKITRDLALEFSNLVSKEVELKVKKSNFDFLFFMFEKAYPSLAEDLESQDLQIDKIITGEDTVLSDDTSLLLYATSTNPSYNLDQIRSNEYFIVTKKVSTANPRVVITFKLK